METEALYLTSKFIGTIIGNDIVSKAINEVSTSIYPLLYGLVGYKDTKLDNLLEKMDIYSQIKTIDSLINNINSNMKTPTLEISMTSLHEIICKIREDLRQIYHKYEIHKEKYLSYYRYINIKNEMNSLKRNKIIMDQRLDLFIKIIQVESNKRK